jgi:asparagine synthase (glutamine-hydrolysing)
MCGIAGWYRRLGRPVGAATIARQCDHLIHRGPDDAGTLIDGDFGFGMRRLSIIDPEHGHQPITSPDGRYAVVCNGEIVNHLDLRRELEPGYQFRTRSDIETLLAAYLRWGDDAWLRFEGMYAAAIWDRHSKTLTLARDPLGIKPLFITEQAGGYGFASEISALRDIPGFEFDIDDRGVDDFFHFGHVLGPRTIFRQVRALEPGHVMTIGSVGSAIRRFWTATVRTCSDLSEREWTEQAREKVLGTVRQHMISDVPVGVFLSGGVDSSAIAAAMAHASDGGSFKAFTAGFPGSKIDESPAASTIARHLGCEHIIVPIKPETAADVLPAVQRSFDEPTAANSAIPLWYLSRAAAEHVKVVLCGEGGDELFMGYKRQRWAQRMGQWSPAIRAMGGLDFIGRIPNLPARKLNYLKEHAERFRAGALLGDGFERFFAAVTITPSTVRDRLYDHHFRHRLASQAREGLADEYFSAAQAGLSPLEQFALGDLTVHMPASLLQRLDRSSMAHSLEARVPFLTHSFVDWALTVPADLKLRGGTGKYLLRRAIEPLLPKRALSRTKLGFQMPLADWFVGGFNDFARDAWRSSGAADAGFLDSREVDKLFDEHRAGLANHGRLLYAIAMFSCWWSEQRYRSTTAESLRLQRA